ncbi:hypothetical protein FA95DRAFT_1600502 [Auriscalpium vulgare]|uniref:Uncharacterized protein n=1 Tax=Auriscalpium vulgare TaxID=40419 RepID=A0ACB8SE44_9AGAM|nr:hypothetical protein FA95DRAFT_1600502 [Auriscalpium vulgare]
MQHSPVFLRLRTIAFSLTTFICFVWIILLSILLSLRWDISSPSERSFIGLFLVVDTITVIVLPLLILTRFRTWLDSARLLLLLVCHMGLAVAFAVWTPSIPCPNQTSDDRGVCQVLNVYINMASWVPPALLITYGICLAVYTWRYASVPRTEDTIDDEEAVKSGRGHGSLPIMPPPLSASWPNSMADFVMAPPSLGSAQSPPSSHRPSLVSSKDVVDEKGSRKSSRKSTRLSKRLPDHFF